MGKDEFCGSWKLYWPDGTPLPHDECPMAIALRQKEAVRGLEAVAERPDGTRIPFIPYPTPLFDSSGTLVGALNMLVDISARNRAEVTVARHRDEQAALYQLTDSLFRTDSLSGVCDAALDAIHQALGCERRAFTNARARSNGVAGVKIRGCVAILTTPLRTRSDRPMGSGDASVARSHSR